MTMSAVLTFVAAVMPVSAFAADTSTPVTLSYAIWNLKQKPAMEAIAAEFTKENPNVTIDIQVTPSSQYWTKMQAAASGGTTPDVFWMNADYFGLYASQGVIAPLDDAIKAEGIDESKYPTALLGMYNWDNKQFGLPKDFDTVGLWYNKELFDKAGVAYPNDSWTWDDLRAAAKKLTNATTGVFGIAATKSGQTDYFDTIAQAGGYIISSDRKKTGYGLPETKQGLQFWLDLIKDGSSPSYQAMVDTNPDQMFQSGKVAMIYSGSWMAVEYNKNDAIKDKIDVARLPAGPKGSISVIHGLVSVVSAKSPNLDIAEKFALFVSGEAAAKIEAQSGAVIPAYAGTQDAWVKSMPQFHLQSYLDEVGSSLPVPASKFSSVWEDVQDKILGDVWTGQLSVDDGADQIAAAMQAALDAEQN